MTLSKRAKGANLEHHVDSELPAILTNPDKAVATGALLLPVPVQSQFMY
jgi:hypothetical protein